MEVINDLNVSLIRILFIKKVVGKNRFEIEKNEFDNYFKKNKKYNIIINNGMQFSIRFLNILQNQNNNQEWPPNIQRRSIKNRKMK